jgi:hypothetical protein
VPSVCIGVRAHPSMFHGKTECVDSVVVRAQKHRTFGDRLSAECSGLSGNRNIDGSRGARWKSRNRYIDLIETRPAPARERHGGVRAGDGTPSTDGVKRPTSLQIQLSSNARRCCRDFRQHQRCQGLQICLSNTNRILLPFTSILMFLFFSK